MLPRGAAPLIAMRKAGRVPDASVWINYGDFREPDWHRWANTMHSPEIVVHPSDPVDRLDFRCVVKLAVTLFLARYDDKAAMLFSRLQDYAAEIVMLSPDFDDDLGMWWMPKYGAIDFDKRHIVTAYESARSNCNALAQEESLRLTRENPWLNC